MNRELPTSLSPSVRDVLNANFDIASLPVIRGTWFYVDPTSGDDDAAGTSIAEAVATITKAYALCTSGAGDGIVIYSRGTTAANTTSYLTKSLTWSKHGITVIGIAAPTGIFGRARIANVEKTSTSTTMAQTAHTITRETGSFLTDGWEIGMTGYIADSGSNNGATFTVTAVEALTLTVSETLNVQSKAQTVSCVLTSYNAQNILISGNNNIFFNLGIWNGGTQAGAIGGIVITGARNYFSRCHFVGGAGCTATANERSLELGDGAQENLFEDCTIGTDTVNRGNNANCELYINGTTANTARNEFRRCKFLAEADTGTAHLAIKSAAATSMGRHMLMRDCDFECYVPNLGANMASLFGGTKFNTAKIGMMGVTSVLGYAAFDSVGANDVIYICGGAAASAVNGIGVAP